MPHLTQLGRESAPRVGLVSCSKAKLDKAARARDLYSPSDLFRKVSSYCDAHCDRWYVLSAKYGLVDPEAVIEPYDLTLAKMPRAEQRRWGQRVALQLRRLGDVLLEAHAGRNYLWPLESAGLEVSTPLDGLAIGQRKRWYLQRMSAPQDTIERRVRWT